MSPHHANAKAAEDWRALSLAAGGRSVIEASAGTGKTWTIAALYLRLLLEEGLTPRQVVVATFTDAAASELRERLRGRLQTAEAMARDAAAPVQQNDAVAVWLAARWKDDAQARTTDINRLRLAMAELDLAPVSTLHGLCARILREQPFAAGSGFEPGNLVDGSMLLAEMVTDFTRLLGQGDVAALDAWFPRDLHAVLLKEKPGGAQLESLLKPGVDIALGDAATWPADAAQILRDGAREGMFKAKSVLPRIWGEVADALSQDALDAITQAQIELLRLPKGLPGLLSKNESDAGVRAAADLSPLLADALQARINHQRLRLYQHLRAWALAHKQAWMQRHAQRSFDDLLLDVDAALQSEKQGDTRPLADALFNAWPVALVDEFQDTDGLQYGILDAVYRDADGAPRGRLVMIGDPKQAIYRFRGGDIHTYQRAAASCEQRLSLQVNQRSSRAYVDAVNRLFDIAGPALDADEGESSGIAYVPVLASARRDATPYTINGQPPAHALQIHYSENEEPHQSRRVARALQACANDIAAMLQSGTHRIGDKPLAPGDIAVLVPTGRNVLQLRKLLEDRGVFCVTQARDSVFDTDTARDLHVLLHGVLHTDDLPLMRAALATPLLGLGVSHVAALDDDQPAMQHHIARLHGWRDAWQRRGVLALINALMADEGPRWLRGGDGERILTDLRHLGEAMQAQTDAGLGPAALLDWLGDQRSGQSSDDEEARGMRQLRIESEAPRVRLMTLHASKGLEFPVVFLPLMWAHGEQAEKGLLALHDEATGKRLLRIDASASQVARREQQDERFRVLYVALTRAVHACHVYALPVDRPMDGRKNAKPVTHAGTARSALDVLLARLPHPIASAGLADAAPEMGWTIGWNSEPFARYTAANPDEGPRDARAMPPDPAMPLPAKHSFSTLTRGLSSGDGSQADAAADEALDTAIDADPMSADEGNEHPELLALAGVRGTGIGNALHAVLEKRVIGMSLSKQPALLRQALMSEGLWSDEREGTKLANTLAQRLDAMLQTPLAADMPALATFPASQLRAEMEFHYPLDDTSLQRLRAACATHGLPHLLPAGERNLRGMMTGKIDLLFAHDGRVHVLDWKGNFLGTRIDCLGPSLARNMAQHHYGLQALLYTIALERHLRLRVPSYSRERHLGDAWYLFVRAVGLAPDAGIWRHRFDDALLDAVDAALPGVVMEDAA